jgi:arabinose-5-phosphate isomerase
MNKDPTLHPTAVAPTFSQQFARSEVLHFGREIIRTEAEALERLVERLDEAFYRAVSLLYALRGNLMVTGIGKAGLIGQKLVATFASTGTRAHFLHPSEALHGDLGRVCRGDVVLMLSQSGETDEVVQLLPALRKIDVPLVAITASLASSVGQAADVTLSLGDLDEACSLGLAPSTSTTVMLAMGDALALVVSRLRGFRAEDFARFHPGGALGLKLSCVEEHMRDLNECRMARVDQTVREVLLASTKPGRRSGAILLVDDAGRLSGLFTDSDLARLIEQRKDGALDRPVRQVMSAIPTVVSAGIRMTVAIEMLAERKFSELPVVDAQGSPIGLIDVTDVVGLLPDVVETAESEGDKLKQAADVQLFPREEAA